MDADSLDQEIVNSHDHGDASDSKSSGGCDDSPCSSGICWPVIIFIVLAIIALIFIVLAGGLSNTQKAWSFFITLIAVIIWAGIMWAFCRCGQQAIAWFLLLIPLAFAIFWAIAVFLASVTCSPGCVAKTTGCGDEPCDK